MQSAKGHVDHCSADLTSVCDLSIGATSTRLNSATTTTSNTRRSLRLQTKLQALAHHIHPRALLVFTYTPASA